MTRSAIDILRPVQSQPTMFSYDTGQRFQSGAAIAALVVLVAFLITGAVRSGGGPGASDHPDSVPARVIQISPSTYLLERGVTASADNICWGDTGGNDPVQINTDRYVATLHGTFVVCGVDQHWNVHRPKGWSYGTALARTGSDLVFDLGAGGVFLLCLSPAALGALGDASRYRKAIKAYKVTAEDVRRELRIAFAKGEIEESEMEHGLNVLYHVGVKPEPEEVQGDPFKN